MMIDVNPKIKMNTLVFLRFTDHQMNSIFCVCLIKAHGSYSGSEFVLLEILTLLEKKTVLDFVKSCLLPIANVNA